MRLPLILTFVVSLLAAVPARGAADARRAQVAAATADALASLEAEVLHAAVTPDLTVEQFIVRTDARQALARTLRRAEQIGGTRWLDDQTCQVRMELPGGEIADALVQIAEAKPGEAGLPATVLRRRVERLREQTFAATGISTSAVDRLRPDPDQPAWRGIPDAAVQAAVSDARRNAARQVLDVVETIEIPAPGAAAAAGTEDKPRLGQVLADQKIRDALNGWLMNRPVTSVSFQPDLEVRVGVAVDGESFWDEMVTAAGDRSDVPFPRDREARDALRRAVLRQVEPTVGRAQVAPSGVKVAAVATQESGNAPVDIPAEPPRWVGEQVDARATSRPVDGRLMTARAAENIARGRLRERLEQLPLSRNMTLGEAARRDDRVRLAIDRRVKGARPRKVNYLADGGAEVTFTLDLRDVWYDLAR